MINRFLHSLTVAIAILLAMPMLAVSANPPPEKTVTVKKGPIQLTLRLYKTKVHVNKSLWYEIELKNIGKSPIQIYDKIFKDPWAMRENIFNQRGIYIDVTRPTSLQKSKAWPIGQRRGRFPWMRLGGGRVTWDWQTIDYSTSDIKELEDLKAKWVKHGLSTREKAEEEAVWRQTWVEKKELEENVAKAFFLPPGASTRTFAWAYWDSSLPPPHPKKFVEAADEESPIGDYTQLWPYFLDRPGKYRLRLVYRYSLGKYETGEKDPADVDFTSREINFEVVP